MRKPESSRRQTTLLLTIAVGGILLSGFVAIQPIAGTEALWQKAVQAVRAVFGLRETETTEDDALANSRKGLDSSDLGLGIGGSLGKTADGSSSDAVRVASQKDGAIGSGGKAGDSVQVSPAQERTPGAEHETPTPVATPFAEGSPTPELSTPTPTSEESPTVTATPTATQPVRRLFLSSVNVAPGENFEIGLSCDDVAGVAGCDVGLEFDDGLIDLVTVHKTDVSDPFLLIKRKSETTLAVSLAAVEGLGGGGGVLLTFEGVASASTAETTRAPVAFSKAKMYDETSRPFPVVAEDGSVTISIPGEESDPDSGGNEDTPGTEPSPFPTLMEEGEETLATPTPPSGESPPVEGGTGDEEQPVATQPVVFLDPIIPVGATMTATPAPMPAVAIPLSATEVDLSGDGVINYEDLFEFVNYWRLGTQQQ